MLRKCDPSPTLRSLLKAVQMEPEDIWRKGFVKERSFKSGVKGRGSDRWSPRVKMVTVMRWYMQEEENQEDSEQNEVDGMKIHMV